MKIKITLISLLIVSAALFTSTNLKAQANAEKAHIHFKHEKYNYGEIEQNSNGRHVFTFTNTGKEPLIINNVRSSCGCTVAKKPTEPIMPGESSEIKVKYNTHIIGNFRKTITVRSNADNGVVVLQISGKVVPKPKEELPVKEESKGFTPIAK